MVRGALSDDHLIQLKEVTGTLNAQKNLDKILESSVRSPLDSLDGQNMVLRDDIARPHLLASSRNTKINKTSLVLHGRPCVGLEPYQTHVGRAWLTCFKPGTSRFKTIVNFARLYCMSGSGFNVLNACTQ